MSAANHYLDAGRASHSNDARGRSGVIVNNALQILSFIGSTGEYLALVPGSPDFHLLKMARPGLGPPLRKAIRQAKRTGGPVRKQGIEFTFHGKPAVVDIEVSVAPAEAGEAPTYRILFRRSAAPCENNGARAGKPAPRGEKAATNSVVQKLRHDLAATQRILKSVIEEQEIFARSFEESYSDLENTSAELDAARWEAETISAELEAANSELQTANRNLQCANDSLRAAIRERDRALEERKAMEEKMLQAQKLEGLGVLAGGIAHDFNNLLVPMLGYAHLALDELPPQSSVRPMIREMLTAGERATDLIRQMLAYSGKGRLATERVNLSDLVEEMLHLLNSSISKKARLDCHLAPDLPEVEADATQIRQVVMNLIMNASEAVGDNNGSIRITTSVREMERRHLAEAYLGDSLEAGRYVSLEVADTGSGMDEETVAKIFDPFFTTKFKGRGLGLAAVLGIVRSHRGAIQVESRLSYGTAFRLLLPACETSAEAAPRGKPATARRARAGGIVLVVDDEENVLRVARRSLEKAGFHVLTAADGREALQVFAENAREIRAVVLDLTMPSPDGVEVLRKLRQARSDLQVIISSGYTEQEVSEKLSRERPVRFLQKPFSPSVLAETVLRAIES